MLSDCGLTISVAIGDWDVCTIGYQLRGDDSVISQMRHLHAYMTLVGGIMPCSYYLKSVAEIIHVALIVLQLLQTLCNCLYLTIHAH